MPRKTTPKYRLHKARNCAVVTIDGRDHYLGEYDSPRVLGEVPPPRRRAPRRPPRAPAPGPCRRPAHRHRADRPVLAVRQGLLRQGRQADQRGPRHQARPSGSSAGSTAAPPPREFSPKKLKAVREAMIAHEITREVKVADEATGTVTTASARSSARGLARKCINKLVGRVKRMFAWAVEEELVAGRASTPPCSG